MRIDRIERRENARTWDVYATLFDTATPREVKLIGVGNDELSVSMEMAKGLEDRGWMGGGGPKYEPAVACRSVRG